jgi:hypothetical protein
VENMGNTFEDLHNEELHGEMNLYLWRWCGKVYWKVWVWFHEWEKSE